MKHLIALALLLLSVSSNAYTIINDTPMTLHVDVLTSNCNHLVRHKYKLFPDDIVARDLSTANSKDFFYHIEAYKETDYYSLKQKSFRDKGVPVTAKLHFYMQDNNIMLEVTDENA